jgi:imidazolonepropionase
VTPMMHGGPTILTGIAELLTMSGPGPAGVDALGLIRDAALVVENGRIAWLGPREALPARADGAAQRDLGGAVVLPGLVDPHTHLVFAGDRVDDFVARTSGVSYTDIALRGGGIATTVRATRDATHAELLALARPRLARLLREGVTTVEIKTGYGLDPTTEFKQLDVIENLASLGPQRIVATLLCHKVPTEHAAAPHAFADAIISDWLRRAVGRAHFVDIFVDRGAWDSTGGTRILEAAGALGFGLKAHTEQLSATGFGAIAAGLGAISLEHLEYASEAVLDAMAASETTAVLLPGASAFLGDVSRPPVAGLRARGIAMALGTDLNPGSSPVTNPWLIATLACTLYGLTPDEALLGMTRHAARAVGLDGVAGVLAPGVPADFAVARVPTWRHLLYGLGHHPVAATWIAGVEVSRTMLDQAFV